MRRRVVASSTAATSTSAPRSRRCAPATRGVGAVASFVGTVRDRNDGAAASARMELEHYPGMTEAAIEAMIDEALRALRHPRARAWSTASALLAAAATRSCWWR